MANISIGSFTPVLNPSEMTVIRADKPTAYKQTYSNVVYFAWPASVVGKVIEVRWNAMPGTDFAALDALYVADAVVVLNPNDGSGKTYNVNILSLDGKYHTGLGAATQRTNVVCQLLIMSEVGS